MTTFLHGVETVETTMGPPPVIAAPTAVIGLVGTAREGPINTPTLVRDRAEAAVFGASGTLPAALTGIFDQVGARVVAVNAWARETKVDDAQTFAAGVIQLGDAGVPGGADIKNLIVKNNGGNTTYVLGTDYAVDTATGVLTRAASGGIAANATVKLSYDYLPLVSGTTVLGTNTGNRYTGVYALLQATALELPRPKIVCVPRWSQEGAVAKAMVDVVAERTRGIAVIDGPNTTDAAAAAVPATLGSRRAYVVDPYVLVGDPPVAVPASPYVAGLIAAVDADPGKGFWWSPSNQRIKNIVGTARPIDYEPGQVGSRANYLNENLVATIIQEDGFRLWGNRTTAGLDDKWTFLSVSRVGDAVDESILRAHRWAVDRNIGRLYLEMVVESVNGYLAELESRGAILAGRAWVDPAKNTKNALKQGKVVISYDFMPPPPAERIAFESIINDEYLTTIFG